MLEDDGPSKLEQVRKRRDAQRRDEENQFDTLWAGAAFGT
jgi:hypothetical protein